MNAQTPQEAGTKILERIRREFKAPGYIGLLREAAEIERKSARPALSKEIEDAREAAKKAAPNSLAEINAVAREQCALAAAESISGAVDAQKARLFRDRRAHKILASDARGLMRTILGEADRIDDKISDFFKKTWAVEVDPVAVGVSQPLRAFVQEHLQPFAEAAEHLADDPDCGMPLPSAPSWVLLGCAVGEIKIT